MHVMVVVVMMMVMVMVVRGSLGSGGGRSRLLRHGVSGEAERENGRGGNGLDHGRIFLWLRTRMGRGGP